MGPKIIPKKQGLLIGGTGWTDETTDFNGGGPSAKDRSGGIFGLWGWTR